jgi:hypothetical protein
MEICGTGRDKWGSGDLKMVWTEMSTGKSFKGEARKDRGQEMWEQVHEGGEKRERTCEKQAGEIGEVGNKLGMV